VHWPFTGTILNGTQAPGDFGPLGRNVNGNVTQGNGGLTNTWIWRTWTGKPAATTNLPMYGMSEIIPEPATMSLLAIGGLTLLRRRRNG
jgi:hypothetical protein